MHMRDAQGSVNADSNPWHHPVDGCRAAGRVVEAPDWRTPSVFALRALADVCD